MEIRHLRYFVSVAERLSFRRAASDLATSQPSLSKQIRALEAELRVDLFERTRRKVELTPAGRFYLQTARQLLDALAVANEQVRTIQRERLQELVIGCARGSMVRYIPDMLLSMRALHPEVVLRVRSIQQAELLRQLRERTVHIGFLHGPVAEAQLRSEPLWHYGFSVVVPAHHPAASQASIDLHQLAGEQLIHYARTTSEHIHDAINDLCHERDFVPLETHQSTASSRVIAAVASGDGFAIVPEQWRFIGTPAVVFRPMIPVSARSLCIHACWHRDERSAIVREFIDVARSSAGLHVPEAALVSSST